MHEAGGDLAEHGLPLLAPDVLLELHQTVGHGVEGVAELADLVLAGDGHALVHAALCEGLGGPGEGEDAGDEGTAPEPAQDDRAEQREADGDEELPLERRGQGERLFGRLFDNYDPGQAWAPRAPATSISRPSLSS